MKQEDAVQFISGAFAGVQTPKVWADLGCGSGTFTYALQSLLPHGSRFFAIDRVPQHLDASITFLQMDFTRQVPELPEKLDGILLANSLHFVPRPEKILLSLRSLLKENGRWVIVEYETRRVSPWVPYPLPLERLDSLFRSIGCSHIEKIGAHPSIYGRDGMYAVLAY